MKEISQFRTEVKCDSVKCETLLSSVNCCLVMYLKFNQVFGQFQLQSTIGAVGMDTLEESTIYILIPLA